MRPHSQIPITDQNAIEDSDDHLADPPQSSAERYERWRAGLIRRHITANGRLDENVFLQERGERFVPEVDPRPRIDFNRRRSTEHWKPAPRPDVSPDTVEGPQERIWWPLGGLRGDPRHVFADEVVDKFSLGNTWGGGDNPLLSGGLALALFSIEQIMGVSQHAFDYARMLFRYIAEQEAWPGYFMREGTHLKAASTDELCGICVGLYYYHKACGARGDTAERQMVEALVRRLGENLNSHGYWILPPQSAFPHFPQSYSKPKLENQRGWIFAYILRLLFERIAGLRTDPKWESDLVFYFGYPVGDPRRMIQWPPPMFESLGEAAEAYALQASPIDQRGFFSAFLAALAASPSIENAVKSLPVVGPWLPGPSAISAYNFHMIGLMSLLLMELVHEGVESEPSELYALVSAAFTGILGLETHKENAFYGLLSVRARQQIGRGPTDSESDLAALLVLADTNRWQHDLPLGEIRFLNDLHTVDPSIPTGEDQKTYLPHAVLAWLDECYGECWLETLRGWRLPLTYNPKDRWGECRTWEHAYDNHVYTKKWGVGRAPLTEGPGFELLLQALFENPGLDLKVEGCGLDFLFVRLLASWWRVLNLPVLVRDVRWKTLPFTGKPGGVGFGATHGVYLREHRHPQPAPYASLPWRINATWAHHRGISKVLQDQEEFPYRRVQRYRVPLPKDSWVASGHDGAVYGGDGRFRGRREFHYDDRPHYFVGVSEVDARNWECYLQFATTRDVLERPLPVLDWLPRDRHVLHNFGVHPVAEQLLELAAGVTHWNDELLASEGLDGTSFLFYRIKARAVSIGKLLPARLSVGNESIRFDGAVRPHWRRLDKIPSHPKHRYFLNPHTGVIHDAKSEHGGTLQSAARSRNVLLLPIPKSLDVLALSSTQLEALVGNIAQCGMPRLTDTPARFPLPRKDRYSLPYRMRYDQRLVRTQDEAYLPYPRLRQYLAERPATRALYDAVNSRHLRLCSHCFPRERA